MNKIILLLPMFFYSIIASFAQPGKLDSSFGDNGIAKTNLGSAYDYGYGGNVVLLQPDGSMYFVIGKSGYNSNSGQYHWMMLIEKKLPDGTTDLAYGSKGYSTPLPISGPLAALQPDGKVVVMGASNEFDVELARFNTDGSLDKTFGNDGITVIGRDGAVMRCIAIQNDGKIVVGGAAYAEDGESDGALLYRFYKDGSLDTTTHFSPNGSELNTSVAIQTDGKIIVMGTDNAHGDGGNLLLRYNPDLSIDSTFSDDGLLQIDLHTNSLKIQNDGKILVAGSMESNSGNIFVVARYKIDGSLDSTFNDQGSVDVGFGISSIVIQGDGKIIVAGSITSGVSSNNFAVARYKINGRLDSTFDADGKKFTDFGLADDHANSIAIRSDGKIIALGSTTKGIVTQIAAIRYNINGSLDNSFDKDGKLSEQLKQGNTSYTSTAIQNDGKIIAAGNTWNGSAWDFALVRYKTDGSLDSTFSGDGKQTTHFGGTNDRASSVAIQTDGKIVVGGSSNNNFALSRYNTDGRPDSTFDGDGLKIVDFGSEDYINKIIILSTGKILVGGSRLVRFNNNGSLDAAFHSHVETNDDIAIQKDGKIIVASSSLSRYNIDGSVDSTFGDNGTVRLILHDEGTFAGISMAIQNDGKIIFGVTSITNSRDAWVKFYNDYDLINFELARINTDGTIDTSFRSVLLTNYINTNGYDASIKIQNDDKIILAGSYYTGSSYNFIIFRHNTDGSLDETFNGTGIQATPLSSADDEIAAIDIVGNKLYAAGYGEFPGTFGVVARYLLSEYDVARVSLTRPANNAIYMAPVTGATVALKATANDLNVTIKSVQFYIGSTLLSTDSTNPYSYTINNLAPGNYSFVAKAIDNNGFSTASATVAISVLRDSVNKAPLVNISNPVTNSTFILPASLTINATASDPDGTIANVKFFTGSTLLATDSIAPYSYKINNPTAGTYKFYAQATDNKGLKNSSSTVSAFVVPGASNKAPAVRITSPANNKNYPGIATLVLNASASDTDGNITNVKFYEGSVLLNTDSTSPYTCSISNPTAGKHSFVARAMDNKGLVSNSASVTVSIGPLANKSPDIKITAPLNNTTFIAGSAIMVDATAIDPDGTISKVEFFNGATLLEIQYGMCPDFCNGPFGFRMFDVVPGTYKLYARATDNKGLAGLSSSVSVFVVPGPSNKAPVIQLTSPANNSFRFTPGTILLSADASDDGNIANVKFYNGSTLIATDSIYPYDNTLTNLPAGNYSFAAKATDNKGLLSNSANAVVAVFKQPNKAPVVNFTSPVNNATYIAPASIILSAAASDEDGTITNVKFYDGAALLKTVTKSPYTFSMNNVPAGTHKFYAKATDNNGLTNSTSTDYVVVTAATNNTAPVTTINQSRAGKKLATAINKPGIMDLATLRLIPNPAHNILNIYAAGLQTNSKETISVISSSGVVMNTIQTSGSGKAIRLNVSSLADGVYFIKMISADKVMYRQLIKY